MASEKKTALILPGGGTGGVIHGGACLAFEQLGIEFDLTLCVSVGSCTGPFSNTGQMTEAVIVWVEHIHGTQFIRWTVRGPQMDVRYLLRTLKRVGKLERKRLGTRGRIVCVTTDLDTGKAVYTDLTPATDPWRFVRASIGIPRLTKPIKVLGRYCGDGGIADPLPIEYAIRQGCNDITVVLTRPRRWPMSTTVNALLGRVFLPGFRNAQQALRDAAEAYRHAINLTRYPPLGVKIRVIEPPLWPVVHFLCTDREKLLARFRHGYYEAYRVFGQTAPSPLTYF